MKEEEALGEQNRSCPLLPEVASSGPWTWGKT